VTSDDATPVTAVVLCGGSGRRFGGDKTRADLGGRTVLDRLLDDLPEGWPVLCVGERRPTRRDVAWLRESPPGGGPAAGLAAALPQVTSPVVVVLGGDMPYAASAAPALVRRLFDDPGADVVAARDGDGRTQPLLAAYRVDALRRALPEVTSGVPLMRLLDGLRVHAVPVDEGTTLDVDTPEDLDRARHRLKP
jgi:molybdopterin-guanine dinucleotide biosynthesis protein A